MLDADAAHAEGETMKTILKCFWIFRHNYSMWTDTDEITRIRISDNKPVQKGIEQHRRCKDCGRLQIRIVWGARV